MAAYDTLRSVVRGAEAKGSGRLCPTLQAGLAVTSWDLVVRGGFGAGCDGGQRYAGAVAGGLAVLGRVPADAGGREAHSDARGVGAGKARRRRAGGGAQGW